MNDYDVEDYGIHNMDPSAWVTWLEQPKGAKGEVKSTKRVSPVQLEVRAGRASRLLVKYNG